MNKQDQSINAKEITAVLFDIVGTLVDYKGTMIDELTEVFQKKGLSKETAEEVVNDWMEEKTAYADSVVDEKEPWIIENELWRSALATVLEKRNIELDSEEFEKATTSVRRFVPWPEASRQLDDLGKVTRTFGLTNSGFAQITEVSTRGQLRWHALLSAQFAQTYKPHPAAYQLAIDLLEIDPKETLFISTHPWDLRGAAAHGFKTAYLPRDNAPDPKEDDQFDLTIESLDELISMLQKD